MSDTRVKVIGGVSNTHEITILSDRFIAKARHRPTTKGYKIECETKSYPVFLQFILRCRWLPIPRVIRLLIFLVATGGWPVLILPAIIGFRFLPIDTPFHRVELEKWAIAMIVIGALAFALLLVKLFAASWHGAEHKAIAAYLRSGSTDIEAIKAESPVNEKCGGRLFLLVILAKVFAFTLPPYLAIPWWAVWLIVVEAGLWIDAIIGFHRLPIFAQSSKLLQRYITTKEPEEHELRTAQIAMQQLLAAHHMEGVTNEAQV